MRILIAYVGSESSDAALMDLNRAGLPHDCEVLVVSVGDLLNTSQSLHQMVAEVLNSSKCALLCHDGHQVDSMSASENIRFSMLKNRDNAPSLVAMSDRISRKRLKEKVLARWENEGGAICDPLKGSKEEVPPPERRKKSKPLFRNFIQKNHCLLRQYADSRCLSSVVL